MYLLLDKEITDTSEKGTYNIWIEIFNHGRVSVLFWSCFIAEINMEQVEYQSIQRWTNAIAKASNTSNYALDNTFEEK